MLKLHELPVEIRSKVYYLSDSTALLLTCKAFALRSVWPELQHTLPPCARERALFAFQERTLRWLSTAALKDILSDDHLHVDEVDVAKFVLDVDKCASCVRWGLLPLHLPDAYSMPRIGPGVRHWRPFLEPVHIQRMPEDRVGLSFLAYANNYVYGSLLGGGLVQWDVEKACEVQRFAPHMTACCLQVVAYGQQLAAGSIYGKIVLFDLSKAVPTYLEELDSGSRQMIRTMTAHAEHMVCAFSNTVQLWRLTPLTSTSTSTSTSTTTTTPTTTIIQLQWELSCAHNWHENTISVLTIWQGMYVISACYDGTICVFDQESRTMLCGVRTFSLLLHLVAYKDKLFSLQQTGHLLEWTLNSERRLQRTRTVCLCGSTLLISGRKLLSMSYTKLRVLDAESLQHEVTLWSPGTLRPMLATRTAVVGIMVNAEMYSNLVIWR